MLILFENIYYITKHRYSGKQSDECTWKVFWLLIVIYTPEVFFPSICTGNQEVDNITPKIEIL